MENFFALPTEKQKNIRNAALKVFGQNGYRKASVKDISDAAGISKSMVFYYFGSKKDLYLYLVDYCSDVLTGTIISHNNQLPNDYFERMKVATVRQMMSLKKEPFFLPFLSTVLVETDQEVYKEIAKYRTLAATFQNDYAFKDVDLSKFKDDVDPKIVLRMLLWMAEGFSKNISFGSDEAFQKSIDEFIEGLEMLRKNVYKEEFQ
jgi:AcrR family transcriptional regulator